MRRLPVYFLIDVSESMAGEPISEVEKGIRTMLKELRRDPYALETVFLSILIFAGRAKVLTPLTELYAFTHPAFPIGSGTALGPGLILLMDQMSKEVRKSSKDEKGDWKPIVFIFTDGSATDDPRSAIKRWQNEWAKHCSLTVVTFGNSADIKLLQQLGGEVLTLTNLTPDSFKDFFQWISSSIQVSSIAVNERQNDEYQLDRRNCINLEKGDPLKHIDENWIILMGKCSKKNSGYLLKYAPAQMEAAADSAPYSLIGAYEIDANAYAELGGQNSPKLSVNTQLLNLVPSCPICSNSTAVMVCNKCGHILCGPDEGLVRCPWCQNEGKISLVDNMDISRGQG